MDTAVLHPASSLGRLYARAFVCPSLPDAHVHQDPDAHGHQDPDAHVPQTDPITSIGLGLYHLI